jgi:hypothetical protein
MPKHSSYKKPICCFIDKINESQHYPGWDSGDAHEEYNDCVYLDIDMKQECWGQVIFDHTESSIDFVSSIHVCQGHRLMIEDNNSNNYLPLEDNLLLEGTNKG